MDTGGVAAYYDRLGLWNRAARLFGYGGGSASLTVHRALADPDAGGRPTFTRVHDIVIEQVRHVTRPRVLDAGCGLGGAMIALAEVLEACCTGLTLSDTQAARANRAATDRGLEPRVRALVRSYDDPPTGPFDVIVAIESLAHSAVPSRSVQALARVLAPGGSLVVIDDMPDAAAAGSTYLARFKAGWQCPVLWGADEYRAAAIAAGLEIVTERDLTDDCPLRPRWRLAFLEACNRLVSRLVPFPGVRLVMDSHYGGLSLERLLRARAVRYRLFVARRPELRVS
jgi:tocopherol O-methyltransferase